MSAAWPDAHPGLPESVARAIAQGRVVTGMTPDQVRLAWGEPLEYRVDLVGRGRNERVRWFRYRSRASRSGQWPMDSGDGRGPILIEREVRFRNNRVVRLLQRLP